MITDKNLTSEKPHLDGVQRIYDLANGYKLSLINSPIVHAYPFAWEAAVLKDNELRYDTPLTEDVEVFDTDEEANAFIEKAIAWAEGD